MSAGFSRATAWAQSEVSSGRLPTAVLGVASLAHGTEVLEGFGASVDDRFALFSVTKPIVALTALREVQDGRLGLDTPLASVAPGVDAGITLQHLLTHTSGLNDTALDDVRPVRETLAVAGQAFAPGTAQRYSSLAFEGIAALVETSSSESIDARIEAMTGGTDLTFEAGGLPVHGAERLGLDVDAMLAMRHPGAGLSGRAQSLLDLGVSLLGVLGGEGSAAGGSSAGESFSAGAAGGLTRSALRASLRVRTLGLPEPFPEPERRHFGLGWHLRAGSRGLLDDNAFGHAGWSGTQWWLYPDRGLVIVLLTNLLDAPFYGVDFDRLNNAVIADLES